MATAAAWLPVSGAGCGAGGLRGAGQPGGARPQPGRSPASPRPLPHPVRAVWVARFHYRYPDDIRTIMRNCARAGLNTVLWQVRGDGTVAYPSRIEPWSAEYGHRNPGFDPLAIAVQEAHRQGLRIEAWVNVLPGWRGPAPPPISNQLWHTHPDWFLCDAAGRRQPLGDYYAILNPCWPEVRRYIVSLIEEIAANYDVDGVHLDYVRYAWDTTPGARALYPRDPQTLRLYRAQTGRHPDDAPAAWDSWRAQQLTRLVADIRAMLGRRRPGATLTAAVWSDPQRGYADYLQDAGGWLRHGLVDALLPMAYTAEPDAFERYIGAYQALAPRGRVIPGVGIYLHQTPGQIAWQLERCRIWGGDFALFSYDSLRATAGDRTTGGQARIDPARQAARRMRWEVVRSFTSE